MPSRSVPRLEARQILALIALVKTRGEISVTDAAASLGVSEAHLSALVEKSYDVAVSPHYCDTLGIVKSEDGYLSIDNDLGIGIILRPTQEEASSLLAALQLLQMTHPHEREIVEGITAKIRALGTLPRQVDIEFEREDDVSAILGTLREAIEAKVSVTIVYATPNKEPAARDIDPYVITFANSVARVIAWCHSSEAQRTFRVDRIRSITLHRERPRVEREITRPEDARVVAHVGIDPAYGYLAENDYVASATPREDGILDLELLAFSEDQACDLVAAIGPAVREVGPPALAASVRARAARALATQGRVE